MTGPNELTNIVIAGVGGQGVIKASDIIADAAFRNGFDVKKSELHGMSQRGGSVASDVRFGHRIFSPMIPRGEADFLLVLAPDQVEPTRYRLRTDGRLITSDWIDETQLANRRCLNVALIGALSVHLNIPDRLWIESLSSVLPKQVREINKEAFALGKSAAELRKS